MPVTVRLYCLRFLACFGTSKSSYLASTQSNFLHMRRCCYFSMSVSTSQVKGQGKCSKMLQKLKQQNEIAFETVLLPKTGFWLSSDESWQLKASSDLLCCGVQRSLMCVGLSYLRLSAVTLLSFLYVSISTFLSPVEHCNFRHIVQTHPHSLLQTRHQILLTTGAEHSGERVPVGKTKDCLLKSKTDISS